MSSPCFEVERITLRDGRSTTVTENSAAQVLVVMSGSGVIEADGSSPIAVAKGDGVGVPASTREFSIKGQWTVEMLRAMVPGGNGTTSH